MTSQQIGERYDVAQHLFHAGERSDALPILRELLPLSRGPDPPRTVAIACLLGETLRGMGDFEGARNYYTMARGLGANLTASQRDNRYYKHYGPRAHIGLIMVLRRLLSPAHDEIRELIEDAARRYTHLKNEDLHAQLNLVEGLFERQYFHVDAARSLLEEALSGVVSIEPPYLFLHPDHIRALLMQILLLRSFDRFRARHEAVAILNDAESGCWSTAVAAAGLLHIRLEERFAETGSPASDPPGEPDEAELLDILRRGAVFEKDPLLLTEHQIQLLARACLAEDSDRATVHLRELTVEMRAAPQTLRLLRAVEASILRRRLPSGGKTCGALSDIQRMGEEALAKYRDSLTCYEAAPDMQDGWREWMGAEELRWDPAAFGSGKIMHLRAIVWP